MAGDTGMEDMDMDMDTEDMVIIIMDTAVITMIIIIMTTITGERLLKAKSRDLQVMLTLSLPGLGSKDPP